MQGTVKYAGDVSVRQLRKYLCALGPHKCPTCECLPACAYGRRYLREVGIKPGRAPNRLNADVEHTRRTVETQKRVRCILEDLAAGQPKKALYAKYGYASTKSMMAAVRKHKNAALARVQDRKAPG